MRVVWRRERQERSSRLIFVSRGAGACSNDARRTRRTIFQETIMGYERYPRGSDAQGDEYGRGDAPSYGRDYDYPGGRDRPAPSRYRTDDRYGNGAGQGYGHGRYDSHGPGERDYRGGREGYGAGDQSRYGQSGHVERSRYGADAHPSEDHGPYRHGDDDRYCNRDRSQPQGWQQQGQGRQPQGYDHDERGFFARAGDEVRSWFGDEEAERRREYDSRMDERAHSHHDHDYHSWRHSQIQSLDRDYDEYRREHRSKFDNEFAAWRSARQGQRDALNKVEAHMDVVGSDGVHVGTVDKVRGDRILLTKNDVDAGGRHHSIPSSWLQAVDGNVTLRKSAADAKAAWRDEERSQSMYDDESRSSTAQRGASEQAGPAGSTSAASSSAASSGGTTLNRSFSGTY
jgi:hypothetical protein